ncbi:MAG TPA: type II toxin-antitoxin system VapC family toxin [Vicinamibacteria bacterium]|nr:type II toxin-antitoxin system VapC family toxin [Vicinamibacteria bacterium]
MSTFVVDANVVAKWFVPERLTEEAIGLLDDEHDLASPDLLWPEIGNVLWKKCRAGELTRREAARILQALDRCSLTVFPSRLVLEGALEIALGTGRSVYDSIYLALAVALECRLVTADERLVNALAGGPLAAHVLWVGAPGGLH